MGASDGRELRRARELAGLCVDCQHAERITSARGSTFILCRLSASDPRFPKYPRQPVVACEGHIPGRRPDL